MIIVWVQEKFHLRFVRKHRKYKLIAFSKTRVESLLEGTLILAVLTVAISKLA